MKFAFWKRRSVDQAREFWNYACGNKAKLLQELSQADRNKRATDALSERLRHFDRQLGFELSASGEATLQVTITAFGQIDSFDSVKELVDAAPQSDDLIATAFRQAEGVDFRLEIAGRSFSPADTRFEPMNGKSDPASLGLTLFFPNGESLPRDEREFAGRLMLQAILGEYAAATCIDHLEVQDASAVEIEKYIPLAKIERYITWHARKHPKKIH